MNLAFAAETLIGFKWCTRARCLRSEWKCGMVRCSERETVGCAQKYREGYHVAKAAEKLHAEFAYEYSTQN